MQILTEQDVILQKWGFLVTTHAKISPNVNLTVCWWLEELCISYKPRKSQKQSFIVPLVGHQVNIIVANFIFLKKSLERDYYIPFHQNQCEHMLVDILIVVAI